MIFRSLRGEFVPCEMKDIKKGDLFYSLIKETRGPLLVATADAKLRKQKGKERWSVKVT